VAWTGNDREMQVIISEIEIIEKLSKKLDISVIVNKFGSIGVADRSSRRRWTNFVSRVLEAKKIAWFYWDFCSEFGIYDV